MASNPLLSIKPIVNGSGTTWTDLPCPSTYKMTSSTLVKSSRNSNGYIVDSGVVREGVRKVEVSWNFLSVTDFSTIAKLFEGTATGGNGSFNFYVKYFDTVIGDFVNSETDYLPTIKGVLTPRQFYVGDRVTDTAKITLDKTTGKPIGYTNVKLSVIEK